MCIRNDPVTGNRMAASCHSCASYMPKAYQSKKGQYRHSDHNAVVITVLMKSDYDFTNSTAILYCNNWHWQQSLTNISIYSTSITSVFNTVTIFPVWNCDSITATLVANSCSTFTRHVKSFTNLQYNLLLAKSQ